MTAWNIVFYETETGRRPVQDYLDGLDAEEAAKVRFDIDLLGEFGVTLGAPYVRSIGKKLWELRTTGRSQHRVLYFAASGRQLVLLHAFAKKTQKTPQAEIETAIRRLTGYQERMGR